MAMGSTIWYFRSEFKRLVWQHKQVLITVLLTDFSCVFGGARTTEAKISKRRIKQRFLVRLAIYENRLSTEVWCALEMMVHQCWN